MRAVVVSEGGYSMRVLLPDRIVAGIDYELTFEVWDPEGEPLAASDVIVTIEHRLMLQMAPDYGECPRL